MTTSFSPSATSRQCPRVSGSWDLSFRSGIAATKPAETRNVTALNAYGTDGPHAANMSAPASGPIIIESVSTVTVSELALASSSSGTRFGIAAFAAGKKNPVATPVTAASTIKPSALSTNGSAANTPKRTMSATIMSQRRESRSTSGPSRKPMSDDRQEVRDEESSDPDARSRQVVDLQTTSATAAR